MHTLSSINDKRLLIGAVTRNNRLLVAPSKASSATFTDGAGEIGQATFADARSTADRLDGTAEFLRVELPRIFRTGEITASKYVDSVVFEDPISRFTDKNGYMFMIRALKTLFNVTFDLHDVRAVQPDQIVTRRL
jgi:hypothetical protein